MMIRSGRMKSSTAAPSLRNSGFETTEKRCATLPASPRAASASSTTRCTRCAVPTGTVDLSTITLNPVMCRPMLRAASSTYCRSAEPSSSGGVPTAMNWISPCATLAAISVENLSRPAAQLRVMISCKPGSWIGIPPLFRMSILRGSTSRQKTS